MKKFAVVTLMVDRILTTNPTLKVWYIALQVRH